MKLTAKSKNGQDLKILGNLVVRSLILDGVERRGDILPFV